MTEWFVIIVWIPVVALVIIVVVSRFQAWKTKAKLREFRKRHGLDPRTGFRRQGSAEVEPDPDLDLDEVFNAKEEFDNFRRAVREEFGAMLDKMGVEVRQEFSRIDRTIEMGSVRPRQGTSPTREPKNPTPPPGHSATEPSDYRHNPSIEEVLLEYHCECGWVGEFASGREDDEKTYCPECTKELSAKVSGH